MWCVTDSEMPFNIQMQGNIMHIHNPRTDAFSVPFEEAEAELEKDKKLYDARKALRQRARAAKADRDEAERTDDENRFANTLNLAVTNGDISACRDVLHLFGHADEQKLNMSPDAATYGLQTALREACLHGRYAIVELLLAWGADANEPAARCIKELPPLHVAASGGHSDVCELLIRNSGNANRACADGWSCVHVCITEANAPLLERVLDLGSVARTTMLKRVKEKIKIQKAEGVTDPANKILLRKMKEFVKDEKAGRGPLAQDALLSTPSTNVFSFSPLLYACKQVSVDLDDEEKERALACVKVLLARGADVHALGRSGATPMLLAASNAGSDAAVEVGRMLIAHGADVNRAASDGTTPLILACHMASLATQQQTWATDASQELLLLPNTQISEEMAMIGLLLEAGASGQAMAHGVTPLIIAAASGTAELVKRLLEAGQDAAVRGPNSPSCCSSSDVMFRCASAARLPCSVLHVRNASTVRQLALCAAVLLPFLY